MFQQQQKKKRKKESASRSHAAPALYLSSQNPTPKARRVRHSRRSMASNANPAECAKGKQRVLVSETEGELAVALAKYTAELSDKYARERGAFTVVLSGGYLIHNIRKLVESPYKESVDWAKWHVFWVDERVVKKDHVDSNYKLAYDGFLSKVPIPPSQVYSINDSLPAEGAADDYEACLKQLVKTGVLEVSASTGFPRFDLMLLGMGPDGHLASLFPGHPLLKENQRWVTYIKDSPKPPPQRITFTFPVIDASAYIAMVVVGSGEVDALKKALGCRDSSSDLLPVQMVSLEDGEFTWFTDKEAVSKLQNKEF
ncbi:probable 6-phosphogluconolactonase 4, chloroplastic [Phoenix dactylifera]|uniref:Probable 6-phosphogluconolactonase n=1 Tax=Phoenix dactylifera TaxID=42345 RepID=A0A8B7D0G9_PHODC|nr:probable 6-phosphogluconolactonase 4, chloroplastic [Phoenix dactylifera]XP_008810712.2 probable 6-phosphogluconolactonase 4, chloroplastic [Phoenix dactylifera]